MYKLVDNPFENSTLKEELEAVIKAQERATAMGGFLVTEYDQHFLPQLDKLDRGETQRVPVKPERWTDLRLDLRVRGNQGASRRTLRGGDRHPFPRCPIAKGLVGSKAMVGWRGSAGLQHSHHHHQEWRSCRHLFIREC